MLVCDFISMRKRIGQSLRGKKGLSTTASLQRRGAIGIVYRTNKLLAMCEMWKLQRHPPMLLMLTILRKSSCLTADLWSSRFDLRVVVTLCGYMFSGPQTTEVSIVVAA